jgi:hypothetical protein
MVNVFNDFGITNSDLSENLFLEEGNILRIGAEPMRLEVLNKIDGVNFKECYDNRISFLINKLEINFIGLQELIKNKTSTNRTKDKADAEELMKRNTDTERRTSHGPTQGL